MRYRVVDVFTETRLEGNPLAVFPDASGLTEATMQKIAQELNLSETAFVLPSTRPGCVARVRIFTPTREMRFAGHPTIGTAWVLRDEGVATESTFALDELVGAVPVRVEDGLIWLQTPPITTGPTYAATDCAHALGLSMQDLLDFPPQLLSAGNPNLYIPLRSRAAVDRAAIDLAGLRRLHSGPEAICVFAFTPEPSGAYSRMFAPEHGVVEDPATGSATGPLAAYMARHQMCSSAPGTRLVSEQGVKMGRRSLLHILFTADGIDVGGAVVPVISATMTLTHD
ncbi:MAG: PhzF family phenazine biosynthesis protein [Bryobacteraceae bacterium]|nr:PhzF family phenazine biosynthesis protein [Bryobacteraceae bacterium]